MNYPSQPGTPGYPPYQPSNPQGAPGYGYAPPQQGYGPPQGYPQQPPFNGYQQPAPQQPVLARGTLEDYLDQPTGGGGAATSKFFTPQRPVGSWLQLVIARDLNNNDVRQQTDKFGTPLTFKSNGKPKFVLIIPCNVVASSDGSHQTIYPEGQVTVWLKGVPSDSFKSAMRVAGISNPDKALALGQLAGASFYMVGAGTKQFGNGNPANMFDFQYTPNGRELAEPDPTATTSAPAPAPVSQVAGPGVVPPANTLPVAQPQQAQPTPEQVAYYQATGQWSQPAAPPAPPVQSPAPIPGAPAPGAPQFQQPLPPPPPPGLPQPQPGAPQGFPPPPAPPGPAAPPAPPAGYGQQPQLSQEQQVLLNRLQGQG